MKKSMLSMLLILGLCFSANPTIASSSIDRQIKESKKVKKYNSVDKHSAQYKSVANEEKKLVLKDPKLIKFKADNIKKITDKQWEKKKEQDIAYYKKNVIPYLVEMSNKYNKTITIDFLNLYLVTERIIRANGLDYINWRIVLTDETTNFNAATTAGNLIMINSALYDSFHNNACLSVVIIYAKLIKRIEF